MKIKNLLIMATVLAVMAVCIMLPCMAYATDSAVTVTYTNGENPVSSNYSTLEDAVTAANDLIGSDITITVNEDVTVSSRLEFNNAYTITSSNNVTVTFNLTGLCSYLKSSAGVVTIKPGSGYTFTFDYSAGKNNSQMFEASNGGTLTLDGVSIKNFNTSSGLGAVCAKGAGNLTINNVTFDSCSATYTGTDGFASNVVFFGGYGTVALNGTTSFVNCTADTDILSEKKMFSSDGGFTSPISIKVKGYNNTTKTTYTNFITATGETSLNGKFVATEEDCEFVSNATDTNNLDYIERYYVVELVYTDTDGIHSEKYPTFNEAFTKGMTTGYSGVVLNLLNDCNITARCNNQSLNAYTITVPDRVTKTITLTDTTNNLALIARNNLTVNGNDKLIISGSSSKCLLEVWSNTAINNTIFKNYSTGSADGIISLRGATTTLSNVSFVNCTSTATTTPCIVRRQQGHLVLSGDITFLNCSQNQIYATSDSRNITATNLNTLDTPIAIYYAGTASQLSLITGGNVNNFTLVNNNGTDTTSYIMQNGSNIDFIYTGTAWDAFDKTADTGYTTDSGAYVSGETTYGVIRFLQAFTAEQSSTTISEYGFYFVDGSGQIVKTTHIASTDLTNTLNAIYGDLNHITASATTTFYAKPYVKTTDGALHFGNSISGTVNWDNTLSNYNE